MNASLFTFIFLLLFCGIFKHSEGCGGGKCSWSTCRSEYTDYSPSPAEGLCVWQKSIVRHIYSSHSKSSGCPGSTSCHEKDRSRYWCSCKQINHCWWASWGPWSGNIAQGLCGTQTRYRNNEKSYTYSGKVGSCNGVVTTCLKELDSEQRQMCNCRKAETCVIGQWTSWSPVLVPDSSSSGSCIRQTRSQDKIPSYTFIMQENNCNGINPSCSPRIDDERVLCSCPYVECIEGAWTAWELHSWTGSCPQERRLQTYRSIQKYQLSFTTCQGIGPLTCPNPVGNYREKVVSCPKLPVPVNGIHNSIACNGADSKCKAICQMRCQQGFRVVGTPYVTCQGSGLWSDHQATCQDIEPPVITCPVVGKFNNTENENFGMVDLPDASATDNSGLKPVITSSHTSPIKVMVGSPVTVTYTATDDQGNKADCRVIIDVADVEPPKVISCPQDKIISTGRVPHQVFWGEPDFFDNVDKSNVIVHPTHRNGEMYLKGKHEVTYVARDHSFNHVTCVFTIQIEQMQCPVYDPPKHGSATCNIRKDGIIETHVCTASCKDDSWFINGPGIPKAFNFYVCGENGQWRGQDVFDPQNPSMTNLVPIPKGQVPWPDCALGNPPDGVTMDFQIFGGSCKNEDDVKKLKDDFVKAMKNDLVLSNLYCITNSGNCVIENFIVYCSSRKKRGLDGTLANTMVIKFSLAVRDKTPSSSQKTEVNKLNLMSTSLNKERNQLLAKVQKTAPSVLKDATTSVNAQNAEIACQPGYEYKIIDGDQAKSDRIKCLKCPRGTYYNEISKNCKVCNHGYYQSFEAALSCTKCPAGTSTFGLLAHDFHECKDVCKPGTYSSTGLATCLACPLSTYQPMENSTICISCPVGKVTKRMAGTSLADCSERGLDVVIQSEGCSDPGIKDHCGQTTMVVNGNDYSPKQRGMNFVVLDAFTGKFVEAKAFDWHNDHSSCPNTWVWVNGLRNDVIVLAAVQDEATSAMFYPTCDQSLRLIGGVTPFQTEYRSSFALIGYKGTRKVDWIVQKKSHFGRGPTLLSNSIKLLS